MITQESFIDGGDKIGRNLGLNLINITHYSFDVFCVTRYVYIQKY